MIGFGYVVRKDLFDIADRILEIDPCYFIFFNYTTKKYEVHHSHQRGSSLAFVVPYPKLDARTLTHARASSVNRIDKILADIQAANDSAQKSQVKQTLNSALANYDKIFS